MTFFISPMGSFQRGILKSWHGMHLDASLYSGSGTKNPLKILQVSHDIVHIHTVLEGFACSCETGYADFVRGQLILRDVQSCSSQELHGLFVQDI